MADIKLPTSFSEQVRILENRGLIIEDKEACEEFLKEVNYYRFSAYLLPFKSKSADTFYSETSFEKICSIYEFDKKMRLLILAEIENIEITLKTQIAHYFSLKYGPLGYLKKINFNPEKINWEEYIKHINNFIKAHDKTPVIKHHNEKYNGEIPFWVSIEYFTLGSISFFYNDMIRNDQKKVSEILFKNPNIDKHLGTWILCANMLRNRCAHYERLYFTYFTIKPKYFKGFHYGGQKRLFEQILVLKFLSRNNEKWEMEFLPNLKTLLTQYQGSISLEKHIGFPKNWYEILSEKNNY